MCHKLDKEQNGRNDNRNIYINEHDTYLKSIVRLVNAIKCALEISLMQEFQPLS